MEKITKKFYNTYLSLLDVDIKQLFEDVKEREWNVENFKFFTAVSVMSPLKIEGEQMEVDSCVKDKVLNTEYLPNLIEKSNDLYQAYEFARDNSLSFESFLKAHTIATANLLPQVQQGKIRTDNKLIMEQQTNQKQYEAASAAIVKKRI